MMQPAQHKGCGGICAFQTVTTAELNGARYTQSLKCVSDSKLAGVVSGVTHKHARQANCVSKSRAGGSQQLVGVPLTLCSVYCDV